MSWCRGVHPVVSWFPPCGVLPGLWLKIRLKMLPFVVSWFPPRGVMMSTPWCRGVLPGFWLKIRLEMLSSVVSWFPPPRGVVVSCLVHGLKLDWKFVSVVSPKWHHGVVSFSRWKPRTLTLKSCDHSFQPIRRLHSFQSHTSLEKLWDFMQKEFPFKEQSCETALLKMKQHKKLNVTFSGKRKSSKQKKI